MDRCKKAITKKVKTYHREPAYSTFLIENKLLQDSVIELILKKKGSMNINDIYEIIDTSKDCFLYGKLSTEEWCFPALLPLIIIRDILEEFQDLTNKKVKINDITEKKQKVFLFNIVYI